MSHCVENGPPDFFIAFLCDNCFENCDTLVKNFLSIWFFFQKNPHHWEIFPQNLKFCPDKAKLMVFLPLKKSPLEKINPQSRLKIPTMGIYPHFWSHWNQCLFWLRERKFQISPKSSKKSHIIEVLIWFCNRITLFIFSESFCYQSRNHTFRFILTWIDQCHIVSEV